MKIDVLGTKYTILEKTPEQDEMLENCDGYCDKTTKTIVVIKKRPESNLGNYDVYLKTIKRHEIIHAFLFESGLHENFKHETWGHEETMVDWIATQFPKLMKAFKEGEAL